MCVAWVGKGCREVEKERGEEKSQRGKILLLGMCVLLGCCVCVCCLGGQGVKERGER